MTVYPNYYKNFSCIADRCKHSCCVGWEIDIDADTLEYYERLEGDMGELLRSRISYDGDPHFCLASGDRCPFLNDRNLCELILNLGEESLCYICSEHPRFKNEFGDRLEIGLGLCCEEAGRIILGQKEDFCLEGDDECDDEIINLRDKAIAIMQNKEKSIEERCCDMLTSIGFDGELSSVDYMLKLLLTLDSLEGDWHKLVSDVLENYSGSYEKFASYIKVNEEVYAKLVIYFLYRYMANGESLYESALRAAFAVSVYKVIFAMSAYIYEKEGSFELSNMVELCRRFSSEIEYDLDNLDVYMEECYEYLG